MAEHGESALQYPLPNEIYGFHSQQSCEKFLKALLAGHGVTLRWGAKLSDKDRTEMRESAALLREHVVVRILELERSLNP